MEQIVDVNGNEIRVGDAVARVSNRIISWGYDGSRAPRGLAIECDDPSFLEMQTAEVGRCSYFLSSGPATSKDGYQFIRVIGARAEVLPGAKPDRIVGNIGIVVDRSVLKTQRGTLVQLSIKLDGHKDFGHGEGTYTIEQWKARLTQAE